MEEERVHHVVAVEVFTGTARTSRRPKAPMPSLVIHFTAAVAPTAAAAPGCTPTAVNRLDVASEWLIHPWGNPGSHQGAPSKERLPILSAIHSTRRGSQSNQQGNDLI